jgi:hypothetical protein
MLVKYVKPLIASFEVRLVVRAGRVLVTPDRSDYKNILPPIQLGVKENLAVFPPRFLTIFPRFYSLFAIPASMVVLCRAWTTENLLEWAEWPALHR